jgi:hypothetical protein
MGDGAGACSAERRGQRMRASGERRGMPAGRLRVGAHSLATMARWGAVIVGVCGCLGLMAGIARATRGGRLTEGVVIVIGSTMTTVVSLAVLLFIAWRVDLANESRPHGRRG